MFADESSILPFMYFPVSVAVVPRTLKAIRTPWSSAIILKSSPTSGNCKKPVRALMACERMPKNACTLPDSMNSAVIFKKFPTNSANVTPPLISSGILSRIALTPSPTFLADPSNDSSPPASKIALTMFPTILSISLKPSHAV